MGVVSLGLALLARLAIQDSIAEERGTAGVGEDSLEGLGASIGASITDAFRQSTGPGVYVTGAGGVVLALAVAAMIRQPTPDHSSD